jgi:hypothetical protein
MDALTMMLLGLLVLAVVIAVPLTLPEPARGAHRRRGGHGQWLLWRHD